MKKRKTTTTNSFFKPIGSSANCIEAVASQGIQSNVEVEAPNLEGGTHNDYVQNPNNQSSVAASLLLLNQSKPQVFQYWKRVNCGIECSFPKHMGDASSAHNYSVRCFNKQWLKLTMWLLRKKR
jgi:hypothetical protein